MAGGRTRVSAICRHKTNFYIDISGWGPEVFHGRGWLFKYMNSIIQDRALFGTDWPVIEVERWIKGARGDQAQGSGGAPEDHAGQREEALRT